MPNDRPNGPSLTENLPPAVLADIFALAASPADTVRVDKQRVAQAPLRTLSHVCRRWRALIVHCAELWTQLCVNGGELKNGGAPVEQAKELVVFTAKRAKELPLDVYVQYGNSTAVRLLLPYARRWRELRIAGLSFDYNYDVLKGAAGQLDNLRAFRMTRADTWSKWKMENNPLALLTRAPALERISVSANLLAHIPQTCLDRIVDLYTTAYVSSLDLVAAALARVPATAHFHFIFYCTNAPTNAPIPLPPAIDSDVERLSIGAGNLHKPHARAQTKTVFGNILASLTAPTLRELTFHKAASNDGTAPLPVPWPHAELLAFATRSSLNAQLVSLDLLGADLSVAQLEETLASLPSLETLALADHPTSPALITTALFRLLTAQHTQPALALVSALHTLTLHTALEFTDESFGSFLRSRARIQPEVNGVFTCMVGVRFGYWFGGTEDVERRRQRILTQPKLKALREEGRLKLAYSSLPEL